MLNSKQSKYADYNFDYLNNIRMRLAQVLDSQQTVNAIFDVKSTSFMEDSTRTLGYISRRMASIYGRGAWGWFGFGYSSDVTRFIGNADTVNTSISATGTWTYQYGTVLNTIGLCTATSSVANSKITITGNSTSPAVTNATLHYVPQASSAVIQWRIADSTGVFGSWSSNVTLTTTQQRAYFSTMTAPAGGFTIEIQVISGTVQLAGIYVNSNARGVVFNKFAYTGAKLSTLATASATGAGGGLGWQNAFKQMEASGSSNLDKQCIIAMHGGNDQVLNANTTPLQNANNLGTFIDNARTAESSTQTIDMLIVFNPENYRVVYNPNNPAHTADPEQDNYVTARMYEYTQRCIDICETKKVSWLNSQKYFGDIYDSSVYTVPSKTTFSSYASAGKAPKFNPDGIHLQQVTGGKGLGEAIISAFVPPFIL